MAIPTQARSDRSSYLKTTSSLWLLCLALALAPAAHADPKIRVLKLAHPVGEADTVIVEHRFERVAPSRGNLYYAGDAYKVTFGKQTAAGIEPLFTSAGATSKAERSQRTPILLVDSPNADWFISQGGYGLVLDGDTLKNVRTGAKIEGVPLASFKILDGHPRGFVPAAIVDSLEKAAELPPPDLSREKTTILKLPREVRGADRVVIERTYERLAHSRGNLYYSGDAYKVTFGKQTEDGIKPLFTTAGATSKANSAQKKPILLLDSANSDWFISVGGNGFAIDGETLKNLKTGDVLKGELVLGSPSMLLGQPAPALSNAEISSLSTAVAAHPAGGSCPDLEAIQPGSTLTRAQK